MKISDEYHLVGYNNYVSSLRLYKTDCKLTLGLRKSNRQCVACILMHENDLCYYILHGYI